MGTVARDVIFSYLRDLGVDYMFGVPGTNEIPIIDGTTVAEYGVTYIPCLHENIAAGAASGYARMTGKPGVLEVHVTPGIAHSVGNLFNAARSDTPLVVLCGQQASRLNLLEPLLHSNLVEVARQYTRWAYELQSAEELPTALQRAFKVALGPPSGPVFISIPWDFLVQEIPYTGPGKVTRIGPHFLGDVDALHSAAERLARARSPVIVVGDGVGYADAWAEVAALANLLGAPVWSETLSSMMNYPNDLPHWCGELPGTQQGVQAVFAPHDVAFLCGFDAQAQVVVFNWADGPLIPDTIAQIYLHNDPWQIGKNGYGEVAILGDIKTSLPFLLQRVQQHPAFDRDAASARNAEIGRTAERRNQALAAFAQTLHTEALTQANAAPGASTPVPSYLVAQTLARLQPELPRPLVYVHEAISDSPAFQRYLRYDNPRAYYCVEGGSLGYSMPASLGIKAAVQDSRIVVNAVGDGSALFYPQVWWTASTHQLPVLYIIMNNWEYLTLIKGLNTIEQSFGWQPSNPPWYLHLPDPNHDFVAMAASFGVRGERVVSATDLHEALHRGIQEVAAGHPYVLDILVVPTQPPTETAEDLAPLRDILFTNQEIVP